MDANVEQPLNDAEDQQPEVAPNDLPPEAVNLVEFYQSKNSEWLEREAGKLISKVKRDIENKRDWTERRDNQVKLFAGEVKPMEYPSEGAKANHDPIMCRQILQLWSRGWDQICPAKGDLIQVSAVGTEDEEIAMKRQRHMNWQLRNKVPGWVQSHAESYLQFLLSGSVFRAKWFDPVIKSTCFDHLTADEVVVPFARKDIDPLMRRVPRITRIRRFQRWDLEALGDEGYYIGIDKLYPKESDGSSGPATGDGALAESELEKTGARIDGVKKPAVFSEGDPTTDEREIFESHTWMLLPDKQRMKPVIFSVDLKSKQPLSLTIREDEDPRDRIRYDAEMEEWQVKSQNIASQYQGALQEHAMTLEQWNVADAMGENTGGPPPEEPPQPQIPSPPEPVEMRTLHNIVHYRLFPNPAGFYGIGVGYLLENSNELVNELSNDYLMAAKFQNIQQGFLPTGSLANGKSIQLQHGKFTQLELEAEQMGGIKSFQFPGPSEAMRKAIQDVKRDADNLIANVDTLSGEAGPTNETKAAAQMRNANATALVSVIVRLYLEPMKEEVKLLAHDNGVFLPEREFFAVTEIDHKNPDQQQQGREEIQRTDYWDEFDFVFTADQRIQSQPERVQTAINVIDRLMASPYTQDAEKGPALFHVAFQKLFTALDQPEYLKVMGPVPQPPPKPEAPQPMAQEDENQMFFADQDHPVLPDDDHRDHLMKMQAFQASPYFKELSSTGKQIADRHYRGHMGFMYRQEAAIGGPAPDANNGMGEQQGPGGGVGPGPGAPAGTPGQPDGGAGAPNAGGFPS